MSEQIFTLRDLGWSPQFQSQLEIDEIEAFTPARVTGVHRSLIDVLTAHGAARAEMGGGLATGEIAVGDWVLLDGQTGHCARVLERKSLLQRRGAGTGRAVQIIAANVDTLFIVSSCNADFNPARIERYLVLARQAGVMPVLVLTKADMCGDPGEYARAAARVSPDMLTEVLNAHDAAEVARLRPWCGAGETVAFAGSSGVGKSTLINVLTGAAQETQGIREDDAKGRHTTTARSLHRLASGGWLIDTPGMRALRLYDAAEGVEAVFEDIVALTAQCRFGDCGHESEPGCAVQAAIAEGALEPARLERWRKLQREEARNSASIAEQRRASKAFGKKVRRIMAEKRRDGL